MRPGALQQARYDILKFNDCKNVSMSRFDFYEGNEFFLSSFEYRFIKA